MRSCVLTVLLLVLAIASNADPRQWSQDVAERQGYSNKSIVLDYGRRLVDECVIVIRPNPPQGGMGTKATMSIMIDYDRKSNLFAINSDSAITIDDKWSDPGVAHCENTGQAGRRPTINRLKSVEFLIVSFAEIDPGKTAEICLRCSKDFNLSVHAKKLLSKTYTAPSDAQYVLDISVDDEEKPKVLFVTYRGYKFELALGKPVP